MNLFSGAFWTAAFERAVKTFAQALVAIITANATGLLEVDWVAGLSVAGLAAVASVLTSVGSAPVSGGGPSLGAEVTTTAAQAAVREAASDAIIVEVNANVDGFTDGMTRAEFHGKG